MNQFIASSVVALLLTACAEKGIPDDRLPFRQHQSAEVHATLDVPLTARWSTTSSKDFDDATRITRLGALTRRTYEDKKVEGSGTALTLRADGTYAWGWVKRTSMAESSAWERGTWEAKGSELRITPESQEFVEGMLNTVAKGTTKENIDLAPRTYTVAALTLRAGSETWEGLRIAGPPPPWSKEKEFSVELQGR